ncbi:centromere protein W [Egretta garzetta]|uniref:centromere protein W n=1 Tax=Egretta garzetta TaxID=188379 RepID=UPI00051F02F5|nr:centromere protein W [Egretta garzetta]
MALDVAGVNTYTEELGSTPRSCRSDMGKMPGARFAEQVPLNFLLFLHRLAEEARTNAFENKSKIIKPEHAIAAAKVILKKSRG